MLPIKVLEGVEVRSKKYFVVGYVYKENLLKAIILNDKRELFAASIREIEIDMEVQDGQRTTNF